MPFDSGMDRIGSMRHKSWEVFIVQLTLGSLSSLEQVGIVRMLDPSPNPTTLIFNTKWASGGSLLFSLENSPFLWILSGEMNLGWN
jgi:hypothetical protein